MDFQASFCVHVADPMGFVDMPFIITTAFTNHGGYPIGEWFLVVPEIEKQLFAQRSRLNFREFPPAPVAFDDKFLLNEVLDQAKMRLRQYIIEKKGTEAFSLLAKRLDVLPSNQNFLVSLWMRGGYYECLRDIHGKTECEPLADFLQILFGLPKFTNQVL